MRRLAGTRQLVAFTGLAHGYDARYASDLDTWMFTFLGGQLADDPSLRATSARMTSVAGGMDDVERIDYMAPTAPARTDRSAWSIEYYNDALDHYFITAEPAEAAMLDAGVLVPGWRRTGFAFKVHPPGAFAGLAACRFFGTPPLGPDSHFYTIDAAECAKVKADPLWTYEGIAFNADPLQASGDCPSDRIPVMRLYNNGMGGQANHRYTRAAAKRAACRRVAGLSRAWCSARFPSWRSRPRRAPRSAARQRCPAPAARRRRSTPRRARRGVSSVYSMTLPR